MSNNREIKVMGIVNLNDDSFFEGSRCPDSMTMLKRVEKMLNDGADMIDIGACSTRPGSVPVSETIELNVITSAAKALKREFGEIDLSIDTFRASVVKSAYDAFGPFTVNDISSGEDDENMLKTVGELRLPYIAMHKRGTPKTMQSLCDYDDVVEEVKTYFEEFAAKAQRHDLLQIFVDPGFGFAKDYDQNYTLLKNLDKIAPEYKGRKVAVLAGISRKSMIWKYLDISPDKALPTTSALHLYALQKGASILRVHDVAEAVEVVKIFTKFAL